jgi:hypothetical protein
MIVPLLVVLAAPHAAVKHPMTAMHTVQVKKDPSNPIAKPEANKPQATRAEPKKVEAKNEQPKKQEPRKVEGMKEQPKKPCLRFPVAITRGTEEDFFPLTTCDGSNAPGAIEHLSILARPEGVERPKASIADLMKVRGELVAPGIKRVDERMPHALQALLDHFDKFGVSRKVHIVSGYRPASKGSYHATAQALDLHIDGLSNEQIVAFCKTLPDVGCGYYPNSTFVHIDMRAPGTGHVSWIDASGPGQLPNYVAKWPPDPFDDDPRTAITLPPLPRANTTAVREEATPLGSAEL